MSVKVFTISRKANKTAKKIPLRVHKKINVAFDILKKNPLVGDKLHGELENFYKYRIGDYRIVYRFDSKMKILIVVKIEHRQGVYR